VIASDGFVGGFKGDWQKAPSGVNQTLKLKLLSEEGVEFTKEGKLVGTDVWFSGPFDVEKGRAALKVEMERQKGKQ
jgi:methylated-DNA-[protein]-cysteine S-methyltransferase